VRSWHRWEGLQRHSYKFQTRFGRGLAGPRCDRRLPARPWQLAVATDRRGVRGARREDRARCWRDTGWMPTPKFLFFGIVDGEE